MSNFPKYNGDIGEPQYVNSMGAEGVSFVDYKCEETMVSGYYDKLIGAGFKKSNGVYIKSVGGKVCVFIGTYAGGDFVLAFSWASYN